MADGNGGGRVHEAGFRVGVVSLDAMSNFVDAKKLGDEFKGFAADGKKEALAVALVGYFKEKFPDDDDLAECGKCLAPSDFRLPSCPFCGSRASIIDDDDKASEPKLAEVEEATEDEPEHEEVPEHEPEIDEPGPEAEDVEPEITVVDAETEPALGASVVAAIVEASESKLSKVKGRGSAIYTTTDLDRAVGDYVAHNVTTFAAYYETCQIVHDIHSKNLWQLRLLPSGKGRYQEFDQFALAELKLSTPVAYKMIALAKNWTIDQVKQLGRSKAALLLRAAPEDREKLTKAVKQGMTQRELEAEVRESRRQSGFEGETQQAKAASKGGKSTAEKPEKSKPQKAKKPPAPEVGARDKVTMAVVEGEKHLDFFATPTTGTKNLNLKTPLKRLAKTTADKPFTWELLANKRVRYYWLKKTKKGTLQLVIKTTIAETKKEK